MTQNKPMSGPTRIGDISPGFTGERVAVYTIHGVLVGYTKGSPSLADNSQASSTPTRKTRKEQK